MKILILSIAFGPMALYASNEKAYIEDVRAEKQQIKKRKFVKRELASQVEARASYTFDVNWERSTLKEKKSK